MTSLFPPRRSLLAGGRERRNQCKCCLRWLLNAMAEFERWSIATEVRARRSAAGSVGGIHCCYKRYPFLQEYLPWHSSSIGVARVKSHVIRVQNAF